MLVNTIAPLRGLKNGTARDREAACARGKEKRDVVCRPWRRGGDKERGDPAKRAAAVGEKAGWKVRGERLCHFY